MTDKDFAEMFPRHFKCFKHHSFLFGLDYEQVGTDTELGESVVSYENTPGSS